MKSVLLSSNYWLVMTMSSLHISSGSVDVATSTRPNDIDCSANLACCSILAVEALVNKGRHKMALGASPPMINASIKSF